MVLFNEYIEEVESFSYLECIIEKDGGANMCVDNRIVNNVVRCLRRILHIRITDRISKGDLWRRSRFERFDLTSSLRKCRWIGQTLRKNNDIAKEALI